MGFEALTPDEARVVDERWRVGAGGLQIRRLQGFGCVSAFVGMAGLTLTPAIAPWIAVDPAIAYLVLGIAIVLLLAGAGMGLVGASRAGAADRQAIDAAVDALAESHATPGSSVEAATVLLVRLREAGPGAVPLDLSQRLGPAAAEVARVEAHLIERRQLPPRTP